MAAIVLTFRLEVTRIDCWLPQQRALISSSWMADPWVSSAYPSTVKSPAFQCATCRPSYHLPCLPSSQPFSFSAFCHPSSQPFFLSIPSCRSFLFPIMTTYLLIYSTSHPSSIHLRPPICLDGTVGSMLDICSSYSP